MTSHITTIVSVSTSIIDGIILRMPTTIIVNAEIIPVAAATNAPDKAVKPADNITTPAPAAKQPRPNNATAPVRATMTGTKGSRRYAATPRIANVPAIATSPFIIDPQLIFPRIASTPANIVKATDAIIRAAAPLIESFITSKAFDNIINDPPRTAICLPYSSQEIFPIFPRAS